MKKSKVYLGILVSIGSALGASPQIIENNQSIVSSMTSCAIKAPTEQNKLTVKNFSNENIFNQFGITPQLLGELKDWTVANNIGNIKRRKPQLGDARFFGRMQGKPADIARAMVFGITHQLVAELKDWAVANNIGNIKRRKPQLGDARFFGHTQTSIPVKQKKKVRFADEIGGELEEIHPISRNNNGRKVPRN